MENVSKGLTQGELPSDDLSISKDPLSKSSTNVYEGKYDGKLVAVKVLPRLDTDYQKLEQMKNEYIVKYTIFRTPERTLIVMDRYLGSWFDYCEGHIQITNLKLIDMPKLMWQVTSGLNYLNEIDIDITTSLSSEKMLLCQNRKKEIVIKITGYSCPKNDCNQRIGSDRVWEQLGYLYYSFATKKAKQTDQLLNEISPNELSQIEESMRGKAASLISFLVASKENHFKLTIAKLKYHPFFTINVPSAKDSETLRAVSNFVTDVKKLEEWYDTFPTKTSETNEEFSDLKNIFVNSSPISEAFEKYPEMYSSFVWDLLLNEAQNELQTRHSVTQDCYFEQHGEQEPKSGGFGTVYIGHLITPIKERIPAACKKFIVDDKADKYFEREYAALKELNHLFIVRPYVVCNFKSARCITMELCEGNLEDYIRGAIKTIPKNPADYKFILGEASLGLAYIHKSGMVHKDLTPRNILLWRLPESDLFIAKIADFGLTKKLNGKSVTSLSANSGTRCFKAPEILKQEQNAKQEDECYEATTQSDVYSFGITVAYTFLEGKHPYDNTEIYMRDGLVPLHLDSLEWDITHLILQLTKSDPKERPHASFIIYHPYFTLTNSKTMSRFSRIFVILIQDMDLCSREMISQPETIKKWVESLKENSGYVKMSDKQINKMQSVDQKSCIVQDLKRFFDCSSAYHERIHKAISVDNDFYDSIKQV